MSTVVPPFRYRLKRQFSFSTPDFHANLADAGDGAVTTTLSRGLGSATFTRATAAASKLSTGLWKLDVASGTPRSTYLGLTTAVGAYAGYLAEGARTNRCLQSRDLTAADWTDTNVTVAKDATGIDGVANSASTLTATDVDGTVLQAITNASVERVFSAWVRRKTGTGDVFITLDNDATRTDITSLINSTTYTLVQKTQTLANPTVGFKLATSGDEIEVDVCQEETGSFASTPIPTTVAAVTRNADALTYTFAGNADATQGWAYAELSTLWESCPLGLQAIAVGFGVNVNYPIGSASTNVSTRIRCRDGTNIGDKSSITNMNTGVRKRAGSWGDGAMLITGDGAAPGSTTFDGDMGSTAIGIGIEGDGSGSEWFGTIKNARIGKVKPTDAQLVAITA